MNWIRETSFESQVRLAESNTTASSQGKLTSGWKGGVKRFACNASQSIPFIHGCFFSASRPPDGLHPIRLW